MTIGTLLAEVLERLHDLDVAAGQEGRESPTAPRRRLALVAADEVALALRSAQHMTAPGRAAPTSFRDRRLRRLAAALADNPGDGRTLDDWARLVGASAKTLVRLLRAEAGLGYREWRLRLRMAEAARRLAGGETVKAVAYDLGYAGPSPFTVAFVHTFGTTPGQARGRPAPASEP